MLLLLLLNVGGAEMADIASANVTVTIERRAIEGKTRRNRVKIVFGDGALTYPAGGIPMPSASSFGMKVRLDYLTFFDESDGTGVMWKYDKETKKLRGYEFDYAAGAEGSAIELDAGSDAPASQTFYAEAVGW